MKLMKSINTRLLAAFGAVLACASMYGPDVKGQGVITSPDPIIIINNNTGKTLWVWANTSTSAGIVSTVFPLDAGASYPYPTKATALYFGQAQTYNAATDSAAAYNVTENATVNVSLSSSGQVQWQQQ